MSVFSNTLWVGKNNDKLFEQSGNFTSTVKVSIDISSVATSPSSISPSDNEDNITITNHSGNEFVFFLSGKFTTTVKTSVAMYPAHLYSNDGASCDEVNTLVGGLEDQAEFSNLYIMSGKITSTVKESLQTDAWGVPKDVSNDGINTTWTTTDTFYWFSGQITTTVKDSYFFGTTDREGIGWDGTDTLSVGYSLDKLVRFSGRFTSTVKDSENIAAKDGSAEGIETSNFNLKLGVGNFVDITLPMVGLTTMNVIVLPMMTVAAFDYNSYSFLDFPAITLDTWAQVGNQAAVTLPIFTTTTFANPGNNTISLTLPMPTIEAGENIRCDGVINIPQLTLNTVAQQGDVQEFTISLPPFTLNASAGQKLEIALPVLMMEISGENGFLGTYDKKLPVPIVNVKASQNIIGTSYLSLPSPTFTTSLLTGVVSLTGGNRTLPTLLLNAHAFRGENGDVAITLPVLSLIVNTSDSPQGTFSNSLFALTLDAYADVHTNRVI
jgi:hypothetical protein